MIPLTQLKKEIIKKVDPKYIRTYGAISPYFVPVYGNLVYFRRIKICLKIIKKYLAESKINSPSIVDIGCGFGLFNKILLSEIDKSNAIGVDLRSEKDLCCANKICNKKQSIFARADIEKLPFKSNKFDIIIVTDVLEHVSKPITALKELKRIVKLNGIIIILVPIESTLFKLARAIIYRRKLKAEHHWTHNIKNINQFENTLNSHFKIIQKLNVPFPKLGKELNYDILFVCEKT